MLRLLILHTFDFDPGRDYIQTAASQMCLLNRFDPVCDYLNEAQTEWDGTGRLDTWLTTYFNADDTPLNRTIGRLFMIAAVRRARVPGCKFDHMLVLEGIEGVGKSTAIVILFGEENFSDQSIQGRAREGRTPLTTARCLAPNP